MSVKHFEGGETKTVGTPEAPFVRPDPTACGFSAVGQTTVVRSGDVGPTLTGGKYLLVNPKWTDTSEDYFVVEILIAADDVPTEINQIHHDAVLFCTTPNPYADAGEWFKVQLRCAEATDEIVAVEIFKADTDGLADANAPDASYGVSSGEHWLVFRIYKGTSSSDHPTIETFVDDVSKGTVTGTWGTTTVNARIAFGAACSDNVKGGTIEITFNCDDFIVLDEDSSGQFDGRMVEALSSGVIIGYQAVADVTGYNDYSVAHSPDPPSWSDKKYRHVDDFNRLGSPPTDDWVIPASTWKQLFDIADSDDASPTVHAIRLDAYPRVVDSVGTQFLAGVSDEGTGPETITGWDDGVNGYVSAILYTTPKDGNAWSKARLNIFYAGLYKTTAAKHINAFGAQVLGIGLTTPTANPDSDNADVADPWAAITPQRRRGVLV